MHQEQQTTTNNNTSPILTLFAPTPQHQHQQQQTQSLGPTPHCETRCDFPVLGTEVTVPISPPTDKGGSFPTPTNSLNRLVGQNQQRPAADDAEEDADDGGGGADDDDDDDDEGYSSSSLSSVVVVSTDEDEWAAAGAESPKSRVRAPPKVAGSIPGGPILSGAAAITNTAAGITTTTLNAASEAASASVTVYRSFDKAFGDEPPPGYNEHSPLLQYATVHPTFVSRRMIDDDAPERCLSPDGSGFIRSDKVPPLSASSNLIDLISASNRRAKRYGCWFIVETFLSVTPSVIVGFMLAALLVMLWGFDETWRALNWQGWATLIVTIGLVLVLLRDVTHPAVVVMAANLALVSLGVISMDDVCEGFGNTGVVTIAIMLIVSEGIKETKALDLVGRYILPKGKQARYLWWAQIRLLFPVQCLSAFLNNTPCVSMNIPVVMNYCKTTGRSPSKMLMPLSFAVIVGGLITLVGTSTNMMVVGMLAVVAPDVKLGMFEIGYIGIPLSIITVLYTILASGLLPDKESLSAFFEQNQHDYTVTVVVQKESVVVGNTIGGAGLRSLSGLFLFAIERNSEFLSEVNPDTVILPQDVLYFTGAVKSVKELLAIDGLQPGEHTKIAGVQDKTLRLMEVVLSPFSNLLGKTIKESQFRTKYKASVVAVSRHGEPIKGKLGNLRLEQGDLLLVLAPPNFIRDYSSHFLLIAEMSGSGLFTYIRWQVALSLVCLLVPVCISAVTKVPLATAGMFGIFILVISGLLTVQQCLKAIEGLVLITVAGSFALSIAITSSGAAVTIASSIVKLVGHWGNFGLLLGIYLPTVALTNIMSNAAVVALMFPIVWSLVSSTGLSVKAAMYVLMVSASSCFILPIGYQTNLMVMGPGSYKMVDFIKFGTPLTLLLGIATLVIPWAMWC